jgi:hypothetical protein
MELTRSNSLPPLIESPECSGRASLRLLRSLTL